jgi:hypothetical protein
MLFFGNQGHQTASQSGTPKFRREWLKRILRLVLKAMDKVETTPRHKQVLMASAERAIEDVGRDDRPTWTLVYDLLMIIGRLLGFDLGQGGRMHTISYWQTQGQYYTSNLLLGGDVMQSYDDKLDAVSVRQRVIQQLKSEDHSDFKIALVMNTTEHQVQQLRRDTHKHQRIKEKR